jgi:pimeloyl-ACP methyl ester carboxylesterase
VHEVIASVRAGALGQVVGMVVLLGPRPVPMWSSWRQAPTTTYTASLFVFTLPACGQRFPKSMWTRGFLKAITSTSGLIPYPLFYAKPWPLDSIIDLDNATRQLVPRAEIQSALSDASALFRAQIDVPVLLMQADHDGLFVPQNDTALFSGWPDVSFVLLGKGGHRRFCINQQDRGRRGHRVLDQPAIPACLAGRCHTRT